MSVTNQASERATQPELEMGACLPTLRAGPVRLRWLTEADIPALLGIIGDPEVTGYWGFARLSNASAASALLADIRQHFGVGTLFQWGIEACESRLVGTCTLANIDPVNRRAELGFALGRTLDIVQDSSVKALSAENKPEEPVAEDKRLLCQCLPPTLDRSSTSPGRRCLCKT